MSEHDWPTSTPAPEPSAEEDEALMKMQRDFPSHRIWREIIPGRTSYVARWTTAVDGVRLRTYVTGRGCPRNNLPARPGSA